MPEYLSDRMSDVLTDFLQIRMPERVLDRMSECKSAEHMSCQIECQKYLHMLDGMPFKQMSNRMSDRMPEYTSKHMPGREPQNIRHIEEREGERKQKNKDICQIKCWLMGSLEVSILNNVVLTMRKSPRW